MKRRAKTGLRQARLGASAWRLQAVSSWVRYSIFSASLLQAVRRRARRPM